MRLRLTKIDDFQFLICLKNSIWGSKSARFKDWKLGDQLVFIVEKTVAGLAEVAGESFISKEPIWDKDIFPYRIPLKFTHVFLPQNRLPILGKIRDTLISAWGTKYGWGIFNQQLLQGNLAEIIIKAIHSQQNDLSEIQTNIDKYLGFIRGFIRDTSHFWSTFRPKG